MRTRAALCATVAIAVAMVSGCRADGRAEAAPPGTNAAPAAVGDPCARLDPAGLKAITGWDLAGGSRPTGHEQPGQAVCNWEATDRQGAVQLQEHAGGGQASFDRRRSAVTTLGLPAPVELHVPGADAAYEVPGHGIVGLLVNGTFAQVQVFGTFPTASGDAGDARPLVALATAVVTSETHP